MEEKRTSRVETGATSLVGVTTLYGCSYTRGGSIMA